MTQTPIRPDVTARLSERVNSAYAMGERNIWLVFPEVAQESTLTMTVGSSLSSVQDVMRDVAKGRLTMDHLMESITNALVLASATGYAVGIEAFDEKAVKVFDDLFGGAR